MTIKNIKEIESIIDHLLETYDNAVKNNNHEVAARCIEIIDYEMNRLEENEIKVITLS
tara:strand:- start:490 stop:663 length:174 start_codon:yes stop_codon:yes gene_type:complete